MAKMPVDSRLVRQPNRWTCLPAAFAMAFRLTYDRLIEYLGENPDQVIRPKVDPLGMHNSSLTDDQQKHRGIGINELVYFGYEAGFACIPLMPIIENEVGTYGLRGNNGESQLALALMQERGVLCCVSKRTGKPHAVFWEGVVLDPGGGSYPIEVLRENYVIQVFWMVKRLSNDRTG